MCGGKLNAGATKHAPGCARYPRSWCVKLKRKREIKRAKEGRGEITTNY